MNAVALVQTPTRLEAARSAVQAINAKLADLNRQMADVERNAEASTAVTEAGSRRQERTGLIARLLRVGRVEADAAELRGLNKDLASAEALERRAAAIREGRDAALAELQAEAAALHRLMAPAQRELAEARFEAARDEIEAGPKREYLEAVEMLVAAYAKLSGNGLAHCTLARSLAETYGISVAPLGVDMPMQNLKVNPVPVGFGITRGGGYNVMHFEVGPAIEEAQAEALRRWREL
jgi:DNA repair exonuclease SbcCD ATPase subunit